MDAVIRGSKEKSSLQTIGLDDSLLFYQHAEIDEYVEVPKKKRFKKAIVGVSKYRLWLFKPADKKFSIISQYPLLHLQDVQVAATRATFTFDDAHDLRQQLVEVSLGADAGVLVQKVWDSYSVITLGWPDDADSEATEKSCKEAQKQVAAGFGPCYLAYCDLLNVKPSYALIHGVESLAVAGKELSLSLLPGVFSESKDALGFDAAAVGWALRHNAHFNSLTVTDVDSKLANLVAGHILAANQNVMRVSWVGGEGEKVFMAPLSSKHKLQVIQVGHGKLSHGSILDFSESLQATLHTLRVLDLTNAQLDAQSSLRVVQALSANLAMAIALEELSLSGNSLGGDAGKALWALLTTIRMHSSLKRLALASTSLNFGQIMLELAFIKGLHFLDLSDNRCEPMFHDALISYFSATAALETLRLANTQLPPAVLVKIVTTLSANSKVMTLRLDLSRNQLGAKGVNNVLELYTSLQECRSLVVLDMSENALKDRGVELLCEHVPPGIQRLIVDHNGVGLSRADPDVKSMCLAIVSMAASHKTLTSFSLTQPLSLDQSCSLGSLWSSLLNKGEHISLTELNLSGMHLGEEEVADMCAALLMVPNLKTLRIDGNDLRTDSALALLTLVRRHKNISNIEFSTQDLSESGHDTRLQRILVEIQRVLALRSASDAHFMRHLVDLSSSAPKVPFIFDLHWPNPTQPPQALAPLPSVLNDAQSKAETQFAANAVHHLEVAPSQDSKEKKEKVEKKEERKDKDRVKKMRSDVAGKRLSIQGANMNALKGNDDFGNGSEDGKDKDDKEKDSEPRSASGWRASVSGSRARPVFQTSGSHRSSVSLAPGSPSIIASRQRVSSMEKKASIKQIKVSSSTTTKTTLPATEMRAESRDLAKSNPKSAERKEESDGGDDSSEDSSTSEDSSS